MRDRAAGLGQAAQFMVRAVHRVREDAAPAQQRQTTARAPPVVGVQVVLHTVTGPHRLDLAEILRQMRVEVDTVGPDGIVEFPSPAASSR